jgi:hypothetical protein
VIWLQARDENTKFFHHFANNWNSINTIWGIEKLDGTRVSPFVEMEEGVHHLSSQFKVESKSTIDVIVRVASFFPRFIDQEENRSLMAEISKEELLNNKIVGLDERPIEFFWGMFQLHWMLSSKGGGIF